MNEKFKDIKIEKLVEWNEANGEGCMASDKITKEGFKVGYMYREEPMDEYPDSGWRFMAGNEDDEYMNDSNNHHIFAINTICNCDRDIIPYIHSSVGCVYIRINDKEFEIDKNDKPIYITKQDNLK